MHQYDGVHQYYETICGGAGPGFDGARAVHTYMTNNRLTDPEVLETGFPVRVEQFAIRSAPAGADVTVAAMASSVASAFLRR
ncbi:hydantoinase/oxoprolinase-like protein [Sinimarinibacterium flocculans]|uniref:Hydantoinase/oxoprolinase-like protein n=1 Tax=Sinimarinibacterium flocculans TaxID=985250 RepID=A0A318ECZ5_9GAMM|nr:hydantoinase B/oxoprolinase family protein [Sinimarinibacterium flocculans]PXV70363.1 hydantoinase/oxoprolinase-like protein [Sinimarinibacterium flocculans]